MSKTNTRVIETLDISAGPILASTSSYRRKLLERLNIPFDIATPGISEHQLGDETPEHYVRRLSAEKAEAVSHSFPHRVVIGSDQAAELDGRILGKPGDASTARRQLADCSGRQVRFLTAVTLLCLEGRSRWQHLDITIVNFRTINSGEIANYVDVEQPLDCAGGFKCEGLGISLFNKIDSSDPTALIGLPLISVTAGLRHFGFQIPG